MTDDRLEKYIRAAHNRFRGQACGYIEAHNLPPKVERSLISVLKSMSYDLENSLVQEVAREGHQCHCG